jgi:hypothetical protein
LGSGFHTKGLDRSIHALASLSEPLLTRSRLYVVGSGATGPYARLARRLGVLDRVVFLGPRDDVPRILVSADLLVHPARSENTGTVLLEALASGLPVVAGGVCGFAPYIEQAQAGWVLPEPFDQAQFDRTVREALEHNDLREIGRRGSDFARRENLYGMVDAAVEVIETVTAANLQSEIRNPKSVPRFWLSDRFRALWEGCDPFEEVDRLQGEVFRQVAGRRTIRFALDGNHYFAKIHHGVGWREILKNLMYLKLPVLGARNEWQALSLLPGIGVPTLTPVAFGQTGSSPARMRSFLITEELTGTTSLEDLCAAWPRQPPSFRLRRALTERVASLVQRMHTHGINHRDCYLCHFHLDTASAQEPLDPAKMRLYVIDLHRAQIRRRTPQRWIVKDLAGLYFSALDIGLTRTDRLRFIRTYEQRPLREVLRDHGGFWRRVERTALALHRKRGCNCS